MVHEKPVGIDLGTTNSAVAWVDGSGRSTMVPNAEGEILTPSIVLFGDSEVVVGKNARSATATHPDLVAEWVKRDMGQPTYSRPIRGQNLPPEVIQACILRKLKDDTLRALGGPSQVVITVPAYFDEPRRKATADAGEMGGLKVLDIVNEPTAAALAFAETAGFLSRTAAPKEEMTVLVYDLGGGTFDVTLLKLAPANIRTLATDGDVQLGGHDWDERLADYLAEAFRNTHQIDPRQDPGAKSRLLAAVIEAKHALSARSRATVRFDHAGKSLEIQVSREQFQELTADLLERTAYTTRQLLTTARLEWKDVSRVLLVGGSTRMPIVGEMLQQMGGIVPDHTVNPDEAVARGAALYAAYLLAKDAEGGSQATYEVTNVNAHSLGVEGIDQETLRKTNVILIPRNTPLPARFTEKFITKSPGQQSIVLQVLEGESSLPGECTAIGRTVIRDLPAGLPQGWPIEVTFEYGRNGRLNVRAAVPGTQQNASLELERAVGLSSEGIARWKNPVGSSAGFDVFEAMVQEVLGSPGQVGAVGGSGALPAASAAGATQPIPPARTPAPPAAAGQRCGATPPVAGPQPPSGPPPEAPPRESHPAKIRTRPKANGKNAQGISRAAVIAIGYVTSAIVGLGLGYIVLHFCRPDQFPFPPW